MRNGDHIVEDMQNDFDEYGDDFTFFILGDISNEEQRRREYVFMAFMESNIRGKGYNYKDHVNFEKLKKKGAVPMNYREELFDFS